MSLKGVVSRRVLVVSSWPLPTLKTVTLTSISVLIRKSNVKVYIELMPINSSIEICAFVIVIALY